MNALRLPLVALAVCLLAAMTLPAEGAEPLAVAAIDASAAPGAGEYADGEACVRKGEFRKALRSYAKAARADGQNEQYRKQYMLLRRIIKIQRALDREKNLDRWRSSALELRDFYYQYGLKDRLLDLAKKMYAKDKSVDSAVFLADAHLLLDQNAEAEAVLASVEDGKLPLQGKLLMGIAQARQGKTGPAQQRVSNVQMPSEPVPRFLIDLARVKVLCGDATGAMGELKTAFQSTRPSALASIKSYVTRQKDFAPVAKSDAFAAVLKTESKVNESDCSGGTSCGSCPSRGSCSPADSH
jgi:hypothetical protein